MWNNPFDLAVISFFGQYTALSPHFNQIVQYIEGAYLFKAIPVMGLLWYFWFRDADEQLPTRQLIIATLIGCFSALVIARIANHMAPFQPRPFANAALPVLNYAGLGERSAEFLFDVNSFPSDHAALFFGLGAGAFVISRRAGSLLLAYILLFIALPRIYLGLHYATDILAGALLGIACVALSTRRLFRRLYEARCAWLLRSYPAAFQTLFFAFSVEICVMFNDVRRFLTLARMLL